MTDGTHRCPEHTLTAATELAEQAEALLPQVIALADAYHQLDRETSRLHDAVEETDDDRRFSDLLLRAGTSTGACSPGRWTAPATSWRWAARSRRTTDDGRHEARW